MTRSPEHHDQLNLFADPLLPEQVIQAEERPIIIPPANPYATQEAREARILERETATAVPQELEETMALAERMFAASAPAGIGPGIDKTVTQSAGRQTSELSVAEQNVNEREAIRRHRAEQRASKKFAQILSRQSLEGRQ